MNTKYTRVIPRDLFNEAKLLKCIGQLVLLIHDGFELNKMTVEHDGSPFKIGLLDDGFLFVSNMDFIMGDERLVFKSLYNSKANYPLYCQYNYCDYLVFDEEGKYTQEFVEFCNGPK